jgi:beta propeller domain-containing protein
LVVVAGGVAAVAVSVAGSDGKKRSVISEPPPIRPVAVHKLVNYDSCADLLTGLRQHAAANAAGLGYGGTYLEDSAGGVPKAALPAEAPAAAGAAAGAASAPQHSDTTVHEPGADEPDMVKTDGKRVVTVVNGTLRVVDTATRRVTGSVLITPAVPGYAQPADLLLSGDRALVIMPASYGIVVRPGPSSGAVPFPQQSTRFVLVDLAGTPKVLGSQTVTGSFLDGRLVGSVARLVAHSQPAIRYPMPTGPIRPGPMRPGGAPVQSSGADPGRAAVLKAPLSAWLPSYTVTENGKTTEHTVDCRQISHPDDYTGLSMLTVYSVDLNRHLGDIAPISLAADGDTVYGTTQSLYVASNPRWYAIPMAASGVAVPQQANLPSSAGPLPPSAATVTPLPPSKPVPSTPVVPRQPPEQTEIHRFDITGGGAPSYLGSGTVPGRLLNQYALSEYAGYLRVATTSEQFGPQQQSAVYVLKADTMARVGSVSGLGKGQRIYSVRFIGSVGYVVTFRQVDPLYTLDLSVPAHPRVAGELELTGYSAYLAPAGDGRLLGIGQQADSQGRTTGLQVALFDVRDPAHPTRLAQLVKNDFHSEAESDPHAFLYWPATGAAVLPVNSWTGTDYQASALVLHVSDSAITEQGTVEQPLSDQPLGISRTLMIGSDLWTMSPAGLQVSNAGTLARQAWIALG